MESQATDDFWGTTALLVNQNKNYKDKEMLLSGAFVSLLHVMIYNDLTQAINIPCQSRHLNMGRTHLGILLPKLPGTNHHHQS